MEEQSFARLAVHTSCIYLGNGIRCSEFEYECGKTGTRGKKLEKGCVRGHWVEKGRPKSGEKESKGISEGIRCYSSRVMDGGQEHLLDRSVRSQQTGEDSRLNS